MTIATVLSALVALAAVIALAYVAIRSRRSTGPSLAQKTVVINTRKPDDQTIRGVLHGQYVDRWTLRHAVVVTSLGEQPVGGGGIVHIPVANIAWAQELE